ncbi:hypothetical protein D9615_004955 [Tricholomella constricta]|uniref:mRNA-decapping enzyme 1B n=1 Tax=Tricholomella constricta TaxID=117010 RepID=A0A8H5M714_9AGAR|nr:hypothetical protein D9615_004955 [Tricholomella constricta]
MGPARRNPSHISTPQMPPGIYSEPPLSPDARQSSVPPKQPNFGMTPASRYQHNLKVLRRRDPSIVSIFDQFSHVCLYHHNGSKWEKQGYEGSMFLYEREAYPPYGFYILNRMGMDDHIQRLYPEDNIGAHGSYLIIRSYPEYTDRRLAATRSAQSNGITNKFSDIYAIPNVDKLTAAEKGESKTIGLWMFATDAREPLIDVFTRLHSYIKKNQPYPQEFRYGPDRPPPSIPGSTAAIANASSHSNGTPQSPRNGSISQSTSELYQGNFQARHPSQTYPNGGASEIDKLFANAKIEPTPVLTPASALQLPTSTSKMTVESLFAALGGSDLMQVNDHRTSSAASLPTLSSTTSSTGISLLDSIFASAHTSRPATTQPTTTQPQPAPITIYSPAPTTSSLPQILNQDVISTLLGLPPSRTASAASASTTYSTGAQSHPSSREGDNEDDSDHGSSRPRAGSDDDGYSESSTVLDPEAENDEELQAAGASAGRPLLAEYGLVAVNGHNHNHPQQRERQNGRMHGDVTPRARMNGFITPLFASRALHNNNSSSNHAARFTGGSSVPPAVHASSSSTGRPQSQPLPNTHHMETQQQAQAQPAPQGVTPGTERALVPFEPDSELWPYPRASGESRDGGGGTGGEGDEILELDFADTSALSDMETFRRAVQTRRGVGEHVGVEGGGGAEGTSKKGRKKGKKERAAEQVRLREEIERSWDVPAVAPGAGGYYGNGEQRLPSTASPSPCPSPELPQTGSGSTARSGGARPHQARAMNGATASRVGNPTSGTGKQEAVRDSVVAAVSARRFDAPALERNDFVREVLTLIHTDKAFVDSLYREYTNRIG